MAEKPSVIAHRGDLNSGIENTIEAAQAAIALGADGLEIDIRQCASGEIVVFHDFSLKRMFGQPGFVGRTELEKLRSFQYLNHPSGKTVYINTLEEFLDAFGGKVPINFDAKTIHFFDFKFADKIIRSISSRNLQDSIWVSCFNPFLLQIIKLKNKKIRTGYLFQRMTWMHTSYDLSALSDAWHPRLDVATGALVKKAKRQNKEVHVWTVNTAEAAIKMAELHVNGVITDDVATLRKALDHHE